MQLVGELSNIVVTILKPQNSKSWLVDTGSFITDVPPEKKHSNISNYLKSFYFTA